MALIDIVQAFIEFEEASGVRANSHTTGSDWNLVDFNTVGSTAGHVGNAANIVKAQNEALQNFTDATYLPALSFGAFIWVKNILGDGTTTKEIFQKMGSSGARAFKLQSIASTNTLSWQIYEATGVALDEVTASIAGLHSNANPGFDLIYVGRTADHKGIIRINGGAVQETALARTTVNTTTTSTFNMGFTPFSDLIPDQLIWCVPGASLAEMNQAWNGGAGVTYAGIGATPPDAPTLLTATATAGTKIALAWVDNSDDETGFKVERSLDGATGWTLINTTAANATSYTDDSLTAGVKRFYRVAATNAEGDSAYTDVESATTLIGEPTLVLTETRPTVVLTETRPTCVLTETRPTLELTEL